jgi:hypothetical protein
MDRKPRSDSKLDTLPESRVLELRDGLLGGWRYDDALSWLATECGVSSSLSALSQFFKRHCAPVLKDRRKIAALKAEVLIEESGRTDWTAATVEMVKQTAFEMMSAPDFDPKTVERFLKVMLKDKTLDLDARKVSLLEAKANRLDALEAKAKEMKAGGGLSAETLEVIEKQLKLL